MFLNGLQAIDEATNLSQLQVSVQSSTDLSPAADTNLPAAAAVARGMLKGAALESENVPMLYSEQSDLNKYTEKIAVGDQFGERLLGGMRFVPKLLRHTHQSNPGATFKPAASYSQGTYIYIIQ